MTFEINRRSFLRLGMAAGAASLAPRWILSQAAQPAPPTDRLAQMRAAGASAPIKTTKLYDNIWLLQGAGGNMAVQTGKDGIILIDSSFATAVPHIREAIAAVSSDAPHGLINTHWHVDHVDGNEGMHAAGYHVIAHEKTKDTHGRAGGDEALPYVDSCLSCGCSSQHNICHDNEPQSQWRHG